MLITVDMLLEALPDAVVLAKPDGAMPTFSSVAFDGPKLGAGEDCLFVGDSLECSNVMASGFAGWTLSLEQSSVESGAPEGGDRTVVVSTGLPCSEAIVRLSIRYGELAAWQCRLKQVLLDGGRYQELVDASEYELGNHIHITDQNLQIVALTKNLQPDPRERYTVEASKTGYFSEEAVELFRKAGRPKKWNAQHGIRLEKSVLETRAPYYDYYFHSQGFMRMHLIMHTNLVAPSPALHDKLQVLVDHLKTCMFNDIAAGMNLNMGAAKALADLALGSAVSKHVLEEEFARALFPTEGPFRMLVFDYGLDGGEGQLASYNAIRLGGLFDRVLVAVHDERVLFLVPDEAYKAKQFAADLGAYMKRHGCSVGISDPFDELGDAMYAYQQSLAALSFTDDITPSGAGTTFHDIFCRWLISLSDRSSGLLSYCARRSAPARILADPDNGGRESYDLLKTYLEEERRASAAAELLHVHRTTLLYQVKRLEKAYGFDLNDRLSRERICAEFRHAEYDPRWKDLISF